MTKKENMKICVLAPNLSTGGVNYLILLLSAIKKIKPNYEITLLESVRIAYSKELLTKKMIAAGVEVEDFEPRPFVEKNKTHINFLDKIINKHRLKRYKSRQVSRNHVINQSDLVFCPWPYEFDCPDVDKPMVCVPHDFNYTHHFGMNIYDYETALKVRNQHEVWFKKASPIVSTHFIANELKRAFPKVNKDVSVVHLSKLTSFNRMENQKVDEILKEHNIDFDFILSANNNTYHKNYSLLYAGYYYFKQRYPDIKLLMTGWGTDNVQGVSNSPNYIDIFQDSYDVKGFGLVDDEVLIALMQKAKMVINPSLYEAGNGSGLDAWGLGAPVVMSHIEPFVEQMNVLGVRAQTFNPKDPKDIAEAMFRVVENPEQVQKDVKASLKAITDYTWDNVAQKYIDVFEKVVNDYQK